MRTGIPVLPDGGQDGTSRRWLLGGGSLVAIGLLLVALAQAPAGPTLTLVNQSTDSMVVSVYAFAGDTLREHRDYWNLATLLTQLGPLPPPAGT